MRWSPLTLLLVTACQSAPPAEPQTAAPPVATTAPPAATTAQPPKAPAPINKDDPYSCKSDADCPRLACGPCKAGEVVTHQYTMVTCTVNPCSGATSTCKGGVCVVR